MHASLHWCFTVNTAMFKVVVAAAAAAAAAQDAPIKVFFLGGVVRVIAFVFSFSKFAGCSVI